MFDESGNALRPWAAAGHACHAFDWVNEPRVEQVGSLGGSITYHRADLKDSAWLRYIVSLRPRFIMGFPDCTDLTVAGTRHWAKKAAINPFFQLEAMQLARTVEWVGNQSGAPWFAENPVGKLATLWCKPHSGYFDPCDYGGYLPENDVHPRWPEYIPPRDAYTKKTGIWSGNGFIMPPRIRVEPEIIEYDNGVKGSRPFSQLGGKRAKTKQIRSEGPRGFLRAVFWANYQRIV